MFGPAPNPGGGSPGRDPGNPGDPLGGTSETQSDPGAQDPGGGGGFTGRRTSNLRGTLFRNSQPQSANVNVSIEREARFVFPKLPDVFSKYPDWVISAEAKIMGCGLSWRGIEKFLELLNNLRLAPENIDDQFENEN